MTVASIMEQCQWGTYRMVLEVMLDHMGCHTMGLVKSVAMRVCLHNMVVVNCRPESK